MFARRSFFWGMHMALSAFAKTPLFWSILLLFGVAFNHHVPDLGETYVSRNLAAWTAMCLSLILLWWRPFKQGVIAWSPLWLAGLFLPVIGGLLVLIVNILGDFGHFHLGHYFLPLMLLTFALFVLGLLQYGDKVPDLSLIIIVIFVAFLPQYLVYLALQNPIFDIFAADISSQISPLFTKPSAGFGQYNLLGSFVATLLILAAAAFVLQPVTRAQRIILALILIALTVDLPFVRSKTALLGVVLAAAALALHIIVRKPTRPLVRRLALAIGLIFVTYFGVIALAGVFGFEKELASRSIEANQSSFSTRFAMWVIGFWGFTENPIFGHGLGSYLTLYMEHYGRYGVAEGLTYYKLVTIPHNLFIHILSETGLFGLVVITGPFIWLGAHLLRQNDNRWLLLAFLLPILLHTQVEYPYIASGAHYWLFGLALVLGQMNGREDLSLRRSALPHRLMARFAFAGLTVYALAGSIVTVILIADMRRAALAFARANQMPLAQFIDYRANAPDLQHPIFAKRLNAVTNLQLIDKIFAEKRFELLRPLALPYFETQVLKDYPTPPIWEKAMQVYAVLGEDEKLLAVIDKMALYEPARAAQFRVQFELYRREKATHPQ